MSPQPPETPPEATLPRLCRERDGLLLQADQITSQLQDLKSQRRDLVKEAERAQRTLELETARGNIGEVKAAKARLAEVDRTRTDLEETFVLLDKRGQLLGADHCRACDRVRFAEAEAENTARRIRQHRHELVMAKRRESTMSVHAYISMVNGLERDLREAEQKYFTLTGELLPAEAA